MKKLLFFLPLVALLAGSAPACADEPSAVDAENALHLFKEGKALRDRGDQAGALEKLRAAHALVATPITALELGRVYAAGGQLIEAREVLLGVSRLPVRKNESQKASEARREAERLAAELRPRLGALSLKLPSDLPADVAVLVDGLVVPRAALTSPRLVNPGAHVVSLARGEELARVEVRVGEGESKDVEVSPPPPPEAPRAPEVVAPPAKVVVAEPPPAPPVVEPRRDAPRSKTRDVVLVSSLGLAAVGTVVGTLTGALTLGSASTLQDTCTPDGRCPASAANDLDAASTTGTLSTVSFGLAAVGLVAFAATYVLWKPSRAPTAAQLGRAGAGLGLAF
jgi:hypothetical protein